MLVENRFEDRKLCEIKLPLKPFEGKCVKFGGCFMAGAKNQSLIWSSVVNDLLK